MPAYIHLTHSFDQLFIGVHQTADWDLGLWRQHPEHLVLVWVSLERQELLPLMMDWKVMQVAEEIFLQYLSLEVEPHTAGKKKKTEYSSVCFSPPLFHLIVTNAQLHKQNTHHALFKFTITCQMFCPREKSYNGWAIETRKRSHEFYRIPCTSEFHPKSLIKGWN